MKTRQTPLSFLACVTVAACGNAESPASVVMGPAGVSELREAAPFTITALEQAFPGYTVIPVADPETASAIFEIRPAPEEPARFTAEADWSRGYVGLIRSRDPAVRGPLGEIIGQTRLAALSPEARALCTASEPARLVCPDPQARGAFQRVYILSTGEASEGAALLHELRYRPPAS